jgi:hypothetical protein
MPDKPRKDEDVQTPNKGIDPKPPKNEEAILNDQDPGHRQKENQNQQKDDPLAA